ncbi:MAG: hypothetical protein Q6368_003395 [Candidatus Baldrarchaeota archaeon]
MKLVTRISEETASFHSNHDGQHRRQGAKFQPLTRLTDAAERKHVKF